MSEIDRIKDVYNTRKQENKDIINSAENPWYVYCVQRREKDIIEAVNKHISRELYNLNILDVGCGKGGVLRDFVKYGADPQKLHGIDVLKDRIDEAKNSSPDIDFVCGDASIFNGFADETFDIVMQFTVFTSILDADMKKKLADNMLRVLKPGGFILWYDYFIDNPENPDTKSVKRAEMQKLFFGKDIHLKKVTLAPPIARVLSRHSYRVCSFLESLRFLNTHYLGVIKK